MPLSCSCNFDEPEYWIWSPDDYSTMPARKRRYRCSCGKLLNAGETVTRFERTRDSRTDIEIAIYGEGETAITLAPKYLCERCSDLYFSLDELGFECVDPNENMLELVKQYAEMAAWQRAHPGQSIDL